jgi:ADP-ribosylglycohydrolase
MLRAGRLTYVHCRAGIGRTGTVVGCFLVERGLAGADALEALNRVWQQCGRSDSWPLVPETDDQSEYVRKWTPQVASLLSQHVAVREEDDPLLEQSTLIAARTLRDRFLGALVGLAVGDALAAATQFRKPGSFTPVGDLLGGGPFDLPRGAWSDDTSMALCLAESLIEASSFDPAIRWSVTASGSSGAILRTGSARHHGQHGEAPRRPGGGGSCFPACTTEPARPEVLSRVAPVVMFYFAQASDALMYSSEAARTTCQAPGAMEACKVLAALLHGALSGKPKPQVLAPGSDVLDVTSLRSSARAVAAAPGQTRVPQAGNVIEALQAALWAFRSTDNFRDGALNAANLGANSDVAAAVYGQLAGAHYGVGAIPATWRTSLMGKDLIEDLADRLLAHAMLGMI